MARACSLSPRRKGQNSKYNTTVRAFMKRCIASISCSEDFIVVSTDGWAGESVTVTVGVCCVLQTLGTCRCRKNGALRNGLAETFDIWSILTMCNY